MRILFLCLMTTVCLGQPYQQPNAAQIRMRLERLNFLGAVLYVAAHPDDENTEIIAYAANGKHASTAYLSMTRGDGGQNLIGAEFGDRLGVIRTEELLSARRIDGGQQLFTRANDFGYSKSPQETFRIWNKDSIMHDAIKAYRAFQPDVIITRFPPDARAGHGHHTASALLAEEAFDLSSDPGSFPALAKKFGLWSPKRLYTNTGRWWNETINENTPGVVTVDVGGFSPLLGFSYTEIAALSRSQHKSQGFGARGTRGYEPEFLELRKGDKATKDIFEGINTTWSRIKGGEKVEPLVSKAIRNFQVNNVSASVPQLVEIHKAIANLPASVWKERKLRETQELIRACLGLYLEATAPVYAASPSSAVDVRMEMVNRSSRPVIVEKITATGLNYDTTLSLTLQDNRLITIHTNREISRDIPFSDPYWLKLPHGQGRYVLPDAEYIGLPKAPAPVLFSVRIRVEGQSFDLEAPLIHKWTDPVKGEQWRPFEIVPLLHLSLSSDILIFNSDTAKNVVITLSSNADIPMEGNLKLKAGTDWTVEPAEISFSLNKRESNKAYTLRVTPPAKEGTTLLLPEATVNNHLYNQSVEYIRYDHIPTVTMLPKAQMKLVKMNLQTEGHRIGYVHGAGDDVPQALRTMGYNVQELKAAEITLHHLASFDAVVTGIRFLNTNENAPAIMKTLLEYAKQGGTLVMQYNTSLSPRVKDVFPFPLQISRKRVTDEESEVVMTNSKHRIFTYPNKITDADFKGWVQERGLYFPDKWDARYDSLLGMHDEGEDPLYGSLLVTPYGSGYFVYTSLSFFRQLPVGATGAFKLFANIVSLNNRAITQPAAVNNQDKKRKKNGEGKRNE